jgi:hypothetical protein
MESGTSPAASQSSFRQSFQAIYNKLYSGGRSQSSPRSSPAYQVRISPCRRCRGETHVGLGIGAFCCSEPTEPSAKLSGDQELVFAKRTIPQLVPIVSGVSGPDFVLSSVSSGNSRWRWNRGLLLLRAPRAFGKDFRRSRRSFSQADDPTARPDRCWRSWSGFRLVVGVERELPLAMESGTSAAASPSSVRQKLSGDLEKAFPRRTIRRPFPIVASVPGPDFICHQSFGPTPIPDPWASFPAPAPYQALGC